ncbi:MAG: acyl-CoA dehydrogenase family protein [bacterium]
MDFELTQEQIMMQKMARDFAEREIVPAARDNDRNERFPSDIVKKMAPLGFLGGPIPEKYGGPGFDYVSYAVVTEEIGRACSSVRTVLSVHVSLAGLTILRWGNEEQKTGYLPDMCAGKKLGCFGLTEPDAGSDPASMSTTAVRDGSDWVLNGAKMWISNAGVADVAVVFAQTDRSLAHRGIAAFIVDGDSPGYSTRDIHNKLGLRSSNTGEIIMEDCRVPDRNRLGEVGEGFKIAMSALDHGRFSVAAGCVGIAQACVDASVKYARERKQFGREIGTFQLVQELISEMVVDTEAARLLVYRAGHLKNKGVRCTREVCIAKYFASEAANRAAYNAIQVHGGYGYSDEYPVERYFRDARVATLYEGTSQIQKLIIGSYALGLKAFT